MFKLVVFATALVLALPSFAACSSAPSPSDICSKAFEKKCYTDSDVTQAECESDVEAMYARADKQGDDCRKKVESYYTCSLDVIDDSDSCDNNAIDQQCNDDDLDCVRDADEVSDDVPQ